MSDGRAFWEDADNSGLMANGQTMARYKTMHEMYSRKYPFLCRSGRQFEGRFLINHVPKGLGMSVDHALLSPTRQWAIVIKMLVDELKARKAFHLLHGISMNTGGGATKVLNLGEGIWFDKTMPTPSPIFRLIQQEANESWEGMYPTFNMGVGLDIVGSPKGGALYQAIRAVSRKSRVRSLKLGKCRCARDGRNHIRLKSEFGTFYYHQK
jgi:phosphoribosylformylglycinamidine cyclo-ligase